MNFGFKWASAESIQVPDIKLESRKEVEDWYPMTTTQEKVEQRNHLGESALRDFNVAQFLLTLSTYLLGRSSDKGRSSWPTATDLLVQLQRRRKSEEKKQRDKYLWVNIVRRKSDSTQVKRK